MTYEWASEAVLEWLRRQGIEPYEVLQALQDPKRWPRIADHPELGLTPSIWGRTLDGRLLIIVLAPGRRRFDHRIVNAYDMYNHQREEFEAWQASR